MEDFGRFENFAQLRTFLQDALHQHLFAATGKSLNAKKYRFEHCLRVAKIGREIAIADSTPTQPLDPQLLEIGCLLHDIGKWDAPIQLDHGRAGALQAYRLLRAAKLSHAIAVQIAQGIAMHVDQQWNPRADGGGLVNNAGEKYFVFATAPSFFAQLIGQCDDLDRFSTYRIFDTLHYYKFLELSTAAQLDWIDGYLLTLEAEWQKQRDTPTLRRRWHENLSYQRQYFLRLRAEIADSENPKNLR